MSSASSPSRPGRRRRLPLAVVFGLIAALVTPAVPAMAVPEPIVGPTALAVAYDGLEGVTVSWGPAPADIQLLGYSLTYVDGGSTEKTLALSPFETSIELTDITHAASTVSVRARFADDIVSEPAQTQVLRGSVANLAVAITRTQESTHDALTQLVTLSSRTALAGAIDAALALVANGAAPDRVQQAGAELSRAAAGLVHYSVVPQYIADYEARDVSGFTPGSQARFAAALDATRQLLAAASTDPAAAVTPEQIETTVNTLSYAYYSALPVPAQLAELLAQAETFIAGQSAGDFTAFSVRAVATAIAGARAALNDTEPTTGALDAAADELQSTLASRVERPNALRAGFAAYAALGADRSHFTGASVRDLANAYAAAVAADDADTATSALSAAGTALVSTIAAVVRVDTLRNALTVNNVALLIPLDYTSTSWGVFARAYAASVDLLAQATAADASPVTELALSAQADSLRAARLALVAPVPFGASGLTALPSARPPSMAALPPGLYVFVIDGMINIANSGGSLGFAAGQFGYTPSFTTPPVMVPTNPGLPFTLPPSFSAPTTSITAPKSNTVDCEVRAQAVDLLDIGAIANTTFVAMHPTGVSSVIAPVAAASPTRSSTPSKTYCNASTAGLMGARTGSDATTTAAAAEATPGYQIVSVLPPTYLGSGNVSVSFALPGDADGGDLFLQYTYNGVYVETMASVEITPGSEIPTVTVAANGTTLPAATARGRLAATGADSGALPGTAMLLLLAGGVLMVAQSARRRRGETSRR